ncbi:hypothetical protein HW49_06330 [Porphyromonadaceae bacterium COT-184 OH4590]|nr:hypothetical protein HW49_06330 [Porphyromonadaceae bacterium COT-184 OH4590]
MKKKHKIIFIVIVVIIVVAVGNWAYNYIINNLSANIHLRDNSIDEEENLIIFKNGGRLIWDTGASGSAIFNNLGSSRLKIGIGTVTDFDGKTKLYPICFALNISFDSITLNNFIHNEIIIDNVAPRIQNLNSAGILGMNVIGNHNWLLDFTSDKIYNFDKNVEYNPSPQLRLTYRKRKTPTTDIKIGGLDMKKLLIDSGFYGDIKLYKSDIDEINKIIKPDTIIDEVSDGLFVGNIKSQNYIYTNVKINNVVFDKLSIIESNRRLIGVGFFRKFDRVFWDSGSKEVRFYRD